MIIVETFLLCDGCGETYGVDNRNYCGREHRQKVKDEGWTLKNGKDYCSFCSSKVKQQKATLLTHKKDNKEQF